jgi:phosphatidate cytidylyltransferase
MEKEIVRTLCITLSYFLIGAIAILRINKEKDTISKRSLWIKYLTYFFIVHFIITVILFFTSSFLYLALLIVIVGFYEVLRVSKLPPPSGSGTLSLIIYLVISSGFIYFAHHCIMDQLLFLYTIVFVFDGFSQITGQLFGKRKLSPTISPNKTVEGLAGGLIMACFTAYLLGQGNELKSIAYAIIICVSSLCGDLAASYYKRKKGVKDYSHFIPGHGGILDRFDSLIAAGSIYGFLTLLHLLN